MLALRRDVTLASCSTLGVGGPVDYLADIHQNADLGEALDFAEQRQLPMTLLGGGSNVVIADRGLKGIVLRMQSRSVEERSVDGAVEIYVDSGEDWDTFVAGTVARGLAGLECLSGIPGKVGATPIQNVGAYGQEVSDTVTRVRVFDRQQRRVTELSAEQCQFGYRTSRFKTTDRGRYLVLAVGYRLLPNGAPTVRYGELSRRLRGTPAPSLADVRRTVLETRREKSMVLQASDPNRRSCGSFFVNPVVSEKEYAEVARLAPGREVPAYAQGKGLVKLPAAWLIEQAGLERGTREGPVGLSTRHTLAIVCHDGATAAEVVAFAHRVRRQVADKFGIRLLPEPEFLGFDEFEAGLPLL